jgi:hypothetical protein
VSTTVERSAPEVALDVGQAVVPLQPPVQVLEIDQPKAGVLVVSPLRVSGRTNAFDVLVLVCDAAGNELGLAPAAGGGNSGQVTEFRAEITFSTPSTPNGVVFFTPKSSEGGPFGSTCAPSGGVAVRFAPFTA